MKLLDLQRLNRYKSNGSYAQLEWIDEQMFKKPSECELCKYKRDKTDKKNTRCRYHRVGFSK